MNKVLIITYYWPPGSGAGVQRWLKFSRYLPDYGWEPVILTVDPHYAAYPAIDMTLEKEIPGGLTVHKTKATDYFRLYSRDKSGIPSAGFASEEKKGPGGYISKFIRGNFFIPDPRRGWNRFAFKKACEIIESSPVTNVITTSPPHSTQLIGLRLKKKYPGLRWIADLRDPWTDIYYYHRFYPTFVSQIIDQSYETEVLVNANKIITVGESLRELFEAKIPRIPGTFEVIPNGFDPEDFSDLKIKVPKVFTISYIGTISDAYPLDGFLKAIKILKESGTIIRLRFVGMVSENQRLLITETAGNENSEFFPYSDHGTSINYLVNSSALLLIIPDHKSRKTIITGKLFEYLASTRPIICIGPPDGDAAGIISETGHGRTFDYQDHTGITEYLLLIKDDPGITEKTVPEQYSRKNLTEKVVSLLK